MIYCEFCGEPVYDGMTTDDGDFYVHEKCFTEFMNREFGEGNWKSLGDGNPYWNGSCDETGGFYIFKDEDSDKWYPTGIYYTDWHDEPEYDD